MNNPMLALSDLTELNAIANNLSEQVINGEYSINEAILEVMPFEYSLADYEQAYVREQVEAITSQAVEE